jgi:hypothetical protein
MLVSLFDMLQLLFCGPEARFLMGSPNVEILSF